MKRSKVEQSHLSHIVPGLVMSEEFLAQASPYLDLDLIEEDHYKRVCGWCLKYWEKYQKAPRKHLEAIYFAWSGKGKASEEQIESTRDLLEHLSESSEGFEPNVPYLLDLLGEYLKEKRLERLRDDVEYSLANGELEGAETSILNYSAPSVGSRTSIDPFLDVACWEEAFAESTESLFTWSGKDARRFFGDSLCRDGLIAMLAPEKRGKTFWLVEMLYRLLKARRKVAIFEVGDMSRPQFLRRIGSRFAALPTLRKHVGKLILPVSVEVDQGESFVETKEVTIAKVLTRKDAVAAMAKFQRRNGLHPDVSMFRISVHPSNSINVTEIMGILKRWEIEDGFIPDAVLVDYPDILAPEPGTSGWSTRDQINVQWKMLRRMTQERHCLGICPTQADAAAYAVHTLGMANFSEDKRKAAHVTGMLGINQTQEEKAKGIQRLNWIFRREDEFSIDRCLHVGVCLPLARTFCCAAL